MRGLSPLERGFAHELTYGVSRIQARLDHLINPWLHQGADSLEWQLRILLRIGLYQLLRMDRVPDYAAVSQTVEMSVGAGHERARGMINAVLRRASEAGEGDDRFPDPAADPAGWLVTAGSHPRWLIDRWLARWDFAQVSALVAANNTIPATHLVPLSGDVGAAWADLDEAGIESEPDSLSGTLRLPQADPTQALAAVPGFVQDPAAALVCRYAAPPAGGLVADLCAAPGGKSLSLARTARYVVAADPAAARLGIMQENARRTGLPIGVIRARAEAVPVVSADLTLIDAPCTGTGTLRRHPDARWRLESTAPAELAVVQARILHNASQSVPVGGLLVYSTCTLEPEENRDQVRNFLAEHPEFVMDPPDDPALPIDSEGMLEVLPQVESGDGAFAARMRRTS